MRDPIMRNFTVRMPGARAIGARIVGARTIGSIAALSLLALTGCNRLDPLERPYMWQATNSNAQNIAAMAANPADLTRGQDQQRRRAAVDSDSVVRLWTGKTVPLITDTPGSASSGASAAPAGGGT
jgi:hypothetical protein